MTTSLLVPCHNAAGFLPRLWKTVQAQTVPFTEIICYDDASTDETAEVATRLGARILSGETNRGPAYARNVLLREARGEWVHFHDADDLLTPEFVARMSAQTRPDIDAVICNVNWIDEHDGRRMMAFHYSRASLLASPLAYVLEHPVGGINGLYRRAALTAINGFDESLRIWEDADLHVRLAASDAHFEVVEEVLCLALRRTESASTNYRENWHYRLIALLRYEPWLPEAVRPALAREAERAALNLAGLHEWADARVAVALARRLGADPPTTRSTAMRIAKRIIPTITLLRFQARARGIR